MTINKTWATALLGGMLASTLVMANPTADMKRAEEIVSGRCFLCHGLDGESSSPIFPRLSGQHHEYMAKQLADFKTGKRKSDTMKPQSADLSAAEMKALGLFFEGKKASAHEIEDKDLAGVGRYIFLKGNKFSGVPACASCHGVNGLGTAQLPRLAGQHPAYTETQLKQFNKRQRTNDNAVMASVASKLTPLEMRAVAEFIATLE